MFSLTVLLLSIRLASSAVSNLDFPLWFKFGASTAAYQVEGAWNVSDKAENIWDRFTHKEPSPIKDLSNGDVAANSFNLWRRDVEMAAELKLQYYRFSISWTRILPTGFTNKISQSGVEHYTNFIDALLEKRIEPIVVMYHFDLPANIQDLGGWTNPLTVQYFGDYARVIYQKFGSRVKIFTTINEPEILCDVGYQTGAFAPGILDPKIAHFLCTKHVLLAHATAYRIYDTEFRRKQNYTGIITIDNNIVLIRPASNKTEDVELAQQATDFITGRFLHPIYSKEGGWPPSMVKIMAEISKNEGYQFSRLPEFSEEEKEFVKGTVDRMHMHYYVTSDCRQAKPGEKIEESYYRGISEINAVIEENSELAHVHSDDLISWPKGLRELLLYLKKTYGNPEIVITENGIGPESRSLKDEVRMTYIKEHLEQVLLSIKEDGVNVKGYIYWSLMDTFEWPNGYTQKFGLYDVDFNSKDRTRTARSSALYYRCIIQNHSLDERKCPPKQFLNSVSSTTYYSSSPTYAYAYIASPKRSRSMKYRL